MRLQFSGRSNLLPLHSLPSLPPPDLSFANSVAHGLGSGSSGSMLNLGCARHDVFPARTAIQTELQVAVPDDARKCLWNSLLRRRGSKSDQHPVVHQYICQESVSVTIACIPGNS